MWWQVKAESTVETQVVEPERVVSNSENADGSVNCYSDKLQMSFKVHVQNDAIACSQRCYIMTIHDLGFDCKALLLFSADLSF